MSAEKCSVCGVSGTSTYKCCGGLQPLSMEKRFEYITEIYEPLKVKIKKTVDDAIVPSYQTSGASGFDLHSVESVTIYPGAVYAVDTGLSFEIPLGYELQVRARSGLSLKTPLRVANGIGSVDSDYRGAVKVLLHNTSDNEPYRIEKYDRIAQGMICPVLQVSFEEVESLSDTERGNGGFGSTGK